MATHKENIIRIFEKFQMPMTAKEICHKLHRYMDDKPDIKTIRVVLVGCEQDGMLVKVKYPTVPTFYCKPEWVKDGKIKKELNFDPYWSKHIYKTTNEHKN